MTSNWTYTVTHFDESNSWASVDITEDIVSIPTVTDTGSGEVNSARIILSANEGKFISVVPYIDQFDRIRIQINDGEGGTYDRYFDVIKILPSESKSQGTRVELFLMGLEHHLQKINYAKPHFAEGAFEVMRDIGYQYNDSKGTTQPTLLGHDSTTYNELPDSNFSKTNYEFGDSEAPCYDRMEEVTDSMAGAVDNGGALDFYDFKFNIPNTATYSDDPKTHVMLETFSSGNNISSPVAITDSTSVNVGETDAGIDNESGTQVLAWGENESGSLPRSFSQFSSAEVRFPLYPTYNSNITYKQNSKVTYLGVLYYSVNTGNNQGHTPPGAGNSDSWWASKTKTEDYGSFYQYSPWTNNAGQGAEVFKDNGTAPTGLNPPSNNELGPGFNDGNIVVWDTTEGDTWFRSWADVQLGNAAGNETNLEASLISGNSILRKYLYGTGTPNYFYRGFRVLIRGTTRSGSTWDGSDSNGKAFANSIVECVTAGTESTAVWKVKYSAATNLSCIVRDYGVAYKYTSSAWTENTDTGDNDCLHPYTSVTNVQGVYGTEWSGTANNESAIKVTYDWDTQLGFVTTATARHKVGGWINVTFPFPHFKHSATSGSVGSHYGGVVTGADSVCEPATLDIENMHLTPNGFRGFNNAPQDTECLGPISSIDFNFKLDYQGAAPAAASTYYELSEANFIMSCILIDSSDNMVKQDFIVPFNNQWMPYKLPISGFTTYRARKPRDSILNTVVPPKEITINNQIEWRNIKQIIIQTAQSYDDKGRYVYNNIEGNFYASPFTASKDYIGNIPTSVLTIRKLDLYLDAFRFTKPLLVTSGQETSKNIEAEFLDRSNVYDFFQLQNIVSAEQEKRKHRHVEFEVNTTGRFNINFGDYFNFVHKRIIPEAVKNGTIGQLNFVTLVAKRIEYSITKPVDGKGGFLRKILGVKRFE